MKALGWLLVLVAVVGVGVFLVLQSGTEDAPEETVVQQAVARPARERPAARPAKERSARSAEESEMVIQLCQAALEKANAERDEALARIELLERKCYAAEKVKRGAEREKRSALERMGLTLKENERLRGVIERLDLEMNYLKTTDGRGVPHPAPTTDRRFLRR